MFNIITISDPVELQAQPSAEVTIAIKDEVMFIMMRIMLRASS